MSYSINSWENIIAACSKYYGTTDILFYDRNVHIGIACDMIALVLQKTSFSYIITSIPLQEPIMLFKDVVFFSEPLFAKYVNMYVSRPVSDIKFVKPNCNILETLTGDITTQPMPSNKSRHEIVDGCSSGTYLHYYTPPSDMEELVTDNNYQNTTKFIQILRVILMVQHFTQHILTKSPYSQHIKFKPIEMAQQ